MTKAHVTVAADGTEAEQRPSDDPVPVCEVLDRLREAAAAHDDELPGFSVPCIPEPRSGD